MQVGKYLREHLINQHHLRARVQVRARISYEDRTAEIGNAHDIIIFLSFSLISLFEEGFRTLFLSRPIRLPSDGALRGDRMIERPDRIGARVPGSRSGHSIAR